MKVLSKKVVFFGMAIFFAILGSHSGTAQVIPVLDGLPAATGAPVVVYRTPVIVGTTVASQPSITPAIASAPVVTAFRAPLFVVPIVAPVVPRQPIRNVIRALTP